MDILIRTRSGESRATLPVHVVPSRGTYHLRDANHVTFALDDLEDGEALTAHMPDPTTGTGYEDDAVFGVTRRDGTLRLVRAKGGIDLDPAKRWPIMLAFSPWTAVVSQDGRTVESWSAETSEEALRSGGERAAALRAEYGRFAEPVGFEAVPAGRIAVADIAPEAGPGPG